MSEISGIHSNRYKIISVCKKSSMRELADPEAENNPMTP